MKRKHKTLTHYKFNKTKEVGVKAMERLGGMNPLTSCQINRTRVAVKIIKRNKVV